MKYTLEGESSERLDFRLIEESDFDSWLPFFEVPEAVEYFGEIYRQGPQVSCRVWMDKVAERYSNDTGGMIALIDRESGKFVGQCGLMIQDIDDVKELEVGYSLLPEFWGNGYAREAAVRFKELAFQRGYSDSVISIIHPKNAPSEKVAKANGMSIEKQSIFHGFEVNIWRTWK